MLQNLQEYHQSLKRFLVVQNFKIAESSVFIFSSFSTDTHRGENKGMKEKSKEGGIFFFE